MSCIICMIESKSLKKCSNIQCKDLICKECLERFVEMCLREQNIPRCVSPNCNCLYLRSECPGTSYDLALFRGLLKDPSLEEQAKFKNKKKEMFLQIVEERRKNLADSFPLSIQRAVNIMYSSELKRIAKSNQESIEQQVHSLASKRCFRLFCRGVMTLDKQWSCSTCETKFCADCETRHETGHNCKEEELASVEWKKALPHCPKCNQPIEKKDGCNFMTCAVCQQNFCYSSGEISQAGNHGKSKPVSVSTESFDRLWNLFPHQSQRTHEQIKLARQLADIQNSLLSQNISVSNPTWDWKASDINLLSNWIKNETNDEEKIAKLTAQRVEKFEQKRQQIRDILTQLKNIEDELIST